MKDTILVLGLGISGKAAAAFLLEQGFAVIALDKNAEALRSDLDVQHLLSRGLVLYHEPLGFVNSGGPQNCPDLSDREEAHIASIWATRDLSKMGDYNDPPNSQNLTVRGISSDRGAIPPVSQVILSPGIPLSHPIVVQALEQNIEVIGEMEMAFRHIKNRCIGITGSNGKTTTTLLITHVLNSCKIKAVALGNVGVGLSSYLLHSDSEEVLVVELSSFQLETLKTRCLDFAIILNITENHLDRYPSMQDYADAKLSIQNCLKKSGLFFVSKQVIHYQIPGDFSIWEEELPMEKEQNVQAAFAICKQFGITEGPFYEAVKTFRKPPHRIEWVAEIDGVVYYNDSKSSNIESVMHAVRVLSGPLVLIVGGKDKGSSYLPWVESFRGKVKHVVAYGMAREKIASELGAAFPLIQVGPFVEAVHMACGLAEKNDTVLLSPGCSSYDQFANFERRGDVFKDLIRQRKNGSKKNNLDCSCC